MVDNNARTGGPDFSLQSKVMGLAFERRRPQTTALLDVRSSATALQRWHMHLKEANGAAAVLGALLVEQLLGWQLAEALGE